MCPINPISNWIWQIHFHSLPSLFFAFTSLCCFTNNLLGSTVNFALVLLGPFICLDGEIVAAEFLCDGYQNCVDNDDDWECDYVNNDDDNNHFFYFPTYLQPQYMESRTGRSVNVTTQKQNWQFPPVLCWDNIYYF